MPPDDKIISLALAFPYMDWTCILLAVRELGKTSVSADFAERMGNLHGAISQALLAAVKAETPVPIALTVNQWALVYVLLSLHSIQFGSEWESNGDATSIMDAVQRAVPRVRDAVDAPKERNAP